MVRLQRLSVSCNRLRSLPREIGQLTALVDIYLGTNQLTSLPVEFCNLLLLKDIDIQSNRFERFPPEIGELNPSRLACDGSPMLRAEERTS